MADPEPAREGQDMLGARLRVPEHVVYREFPEETIVLNLDSGMYHGLNRTASRMLDVVREKDSVGAAVDALAAEFGQPREVIAGELVGLCRTLEERGLVKRDDA